jgi:hypothetical protein
LTFKDLKKRVNLETLAKQQYIYLKDCKINHFGFRMYKSITKKILKQMETAAAILLFPTKVLKSSLPSVASLQSCKLNPIFFALAEG